MKLASLDLPELGRDEVWETQKGMVDSESSVTSLFMYIESWEEVLLHSNGNQLMVS